MLGQGCKYLGQTPPDRGYPIHVTNLEARCHNDDCEGNNSGVHCNNDNDFFHRADPGTIPMPGLGELSQKSTFQLSKAIFSSELEINETHCGLAVL